ncbi:unnamed protein product [Strongylus vulgaris]|uniref:Uncharacterized protein n=1 Tax=Strongylus vulgaris TaxID=40348 RepID=A0A3P7KM01_STRVU|nr:unnamed protein product [Strongylus vulgaris]
MQTMSNTKKASVQAIESEIDAAMGAGPYGVANEKETAPFWSDFDPALFKELVAEVSQQTSPVNMNDEESQFVLNVELKEVQTSDLDSVIEVSEKCCTATIKENNGVQATAEFREVASGQLDNESWIKIYINELDEERRSRMLDVGVQTGVLARVQHLYTIQDLEADVEASIGQSQGVHPIPLEEIIGGGVKKRVPERRSSVAQRLSFSETSMLDRLRSVYESGNVKDFPSAKGKPSPSNRAHADGNSRVGDGD